MTDHRPRPIDVFHDECMARAEAERPPAVSPSAVVSADRATLREWIAAALYEHMHPGSYWSDTSMPSDWRPTYLEEADAVLAALADGPSRLAAEEQPAETQAPDPTEADVDRMLAEGVPVQIVTEPPATYGPRRAATVDPAVCPRCKGDNSEAFELCARCAASPAVGERPVECAASISGSCLTEAESETACDTEDGECVHGGRPAVGERPDTHRPRRGDAVETWLKAQRDKYDRTDQHEESSEFWHEFDAALDLYRLHADTGTPLGEHICEGRVVGDCACLERSDTQTPEADRG